MKPAAGTAGPEALDYRIRWRGHDPHPGAHASRVAGSGDVFRGVVPLGEGRDARRLDLRASVTDPWGRPWVREYRQRARVPVALLADVSNSMRFSGRGERLATCARFARALARAAFGNGDPFAFVACDTTVRRELLLPAAVSRHGGETAARRLEAARAEAPRREGAGAQGLEQAVRWLPQRRSLVFLLSDLYLDDTLLERVLRSLAAHERVLLLLADSAERRPPARWGLARLADLESGRERLLLLRPGLARRLAAAQDERIERCTRLARRHGAALLVAEDGLDTAAVARHFLGHGGRA